MVVIATLLDLIPNFAHFTRTCEVMGATALVLPNKMVMNSKDYTKISVTAEKWLTILEVKEHDLQNYLIFQKNRGFKLIGLEQTAKSIKLQDFSFPKKTLLLLGNERKGMKAKYIDVIYRFVFNHLKRCLIKR